MQTNLQQYLDKTEQELKLRNYSRKTVKAYLLCLGKYIDFLTKNSNLIRNLNSEEKIKKFLLLHQERGGKLTERTAQKIFENAIKAADIKKPATFHSLRHFFCHPSLGKWRGCPLCAGTFRPCQYQNHANLYPGY